VALGEKRRPRPAAHRCFDFSQLIGQPERLDCGRVGKPQQRGMALGQGENTASQRRAMQHYSQVGQLPDQP
jgi:hypothetical protein